MTTTEDQVARSLASAVMLCLHDFSPEDDYAELASLPVDPERGRLMFEYEGQQHPLTWGPTQIFLVPGVTVEMGTGINRRGRIISPVIVSIARDINNSGHEREQEYLGQMVAKIRPLIFDVKSCPVYEFIADQPGASAIVDQIDWHDELFTLVMSAPREGWVGNFEPGGWLRKEITFSVAYRIQES